MKTDWMKLKEAMKSCAKELKDLKKQIRSQTGIDSDQWYARKNLKWEATRLYSIAAHLRGNVHRKDWTMEQQAEFLGRSAESFQVQEAA